MKKYYIKVSFIFSVLFIIISFSNVKADLPLSGKLIVVDPGHGAQDPGTIYKNIYEKDINLSISLFLEKELTKLGASVILTREGDYDLSTPNATHRKKSDFDNRIKLINESNADLYLSIHLNYLNDFQYKGAQVFFIDKNKKLAQTVQNSLNKSLKSNREIKKIPSSTYMYKKINIDGLLIECGFLSNSYERNLLLKEEYQVKIASSIAQAISNYYK